MNINLLVGESGARSDNQIYTTVARWALTIGVFLLPLFFLPQTTSPLEFNKQMLLLVVASVGLIAWLLGVVSSGRLSWRSTLLDKGVLAVLVATIVTAVLSQGRFQSIFGINASVSGSLVSIASLTILFFLMTNLWHDRGVRLRSILILSIMVGLWYGLLQLLGVFGLPISITASRAFNSVGSPNGLGILAAVSLPLFLNTIGWKRYISILGIIPALAILVILNWWVIWVVVVAGMVGYIVVSALLESFKISRFILPMTVVVLGVFLLLIKPNLPFKSKLPVEVAPSYSLSFKIAQSVLHEEFFTGYGPENFSMAFDKYGAKKLANTTFSSAQFFDSASELFNQIIQGGIVMGVAWVLVLWSLIQLFVYVVRHRSQVDRNAAAVWASLIALGVAFCLYPFNLTLIFVFYAVAALSMLVEWGSDHKELHVEEHIALSLISSLGFIAGLILVLVGIYFGASRYIADIHYRNALGAKDIHLAAGEIDKATEWNNQDDRYYRAAAQVSLGLLSQELAKKADPQDTQRNTRIQNYLAAAINFSKQATQLNKKEAANWDNLGTIYQNLMGFVEGVDKLAETAYGAASQLRPGDASYSNKIGLLNITKADLIRQLAKNNPSVAQSYGTVESALSAAEASFKRAIDMSNTFGLAIYNLGTVYERQGKLGEAIRELEKIAPFNNDAPDLLFELGLLYYRAGNKNKAFETLQRVLVLSPDFANAHWYLALIYEERKDTAAAISELEKILSVESNKNNQTVLQKLEQIRSGKVSGDKAIDQKPL
ncbi:tetratricopeptide repeat protein [Candidatus Parcubacteria bacterium]|nr:tetratricopeptide repeat protein [Candidatus Parcubacteria bacterium]